MGKYPGNLLIWQRPCYRRSDNQVKDRSSDSVVPHGRGEGQRNETMKSAITKMILFPCLSAAVTACLLQAGCASGRPKPSHVNDTPAAPVAEARPDGGASTGTRSANLSVLEGQQLTLDACIRLALSNNPGLKAAHYDARWSRLDADAERSAALPRLRAIGGYASYINKQPLIPIGGNPQASTFTRDILSAAAVLDIPLYTGGRMAGRIASAELLSKASEDTLHRTRRELVFNVTSVFYSILEQRRVIASAAFSCKALEEQRRQVQNMCNKQRATRADLLRTEARLAEVRESLARLRNVLAVKFCVLEQLLGMEGMNGQLALQGDLGGTEERLPDEGEAVSSAFASRRDLAAARSRLGARERAVAAARAEHWPDITFHAAYGPRWDASDMDTMEDAGSVGVGIVVPLFEGGRIKANVLKQKAKAAAARERLRWLTLQVRLEVRQALKNASSARERIDASRKALAQGEESLRMERLKYGEGRASMTDVLDVQDQLLRSQKTHYGALADYKVAVAELWLAMGKD